MVALYEFINTNPLGESVIITSLNRNHTIIAFFKQFIGFAQYCLVLPEINARINIEISFELPVSFYTFRHRVIKALINSNTIMNQIIGYTSSKSSNEVFNSLGRIAAA